MLTTGGPQAAHERGRAKGATGMEGYAAHEDEYTPLPVDVSLPRAGLNMTLPRTKKAKGGSCPRIRRIIPPNQPPRNKTKKAGPPADRNELHRRRSPREEKGRVPGGRSADECCTVEHENHGRPPSAPHAWKQGRIPRQTRSRKQ
ncbi:hypothetical protein C8J57DRAFT_1214008 [Mycena rebaudengoi]|nr:hypothetical protein C8J57DRAFT_1214008 [Mycena rebaudengoi]